MSASISDREALVALNMAGRIGPVTVRKLFDRLGSFSAILTASIGDIRGIPGIGIGLCEALSAARQVEWQKEIDRAESLGISIVTQLDAAFPPALKTIHDPPLALYLKGRLNSRDAMAVAIVGTRRPSVYGLGVAERLAYQLATAGVTVVSGMAEGIDTAAHQGAIKAKGRTIAVLGGAHDCLYPLSNAGLAERIAENGAVLSEFPLGRQPDKTTFPMRNRIVSGLSKGVVVVEASMRSGAMITANEALEQGRQVFAVPGRIDSNNSRGPHSLIKNGAKLVESVDDVLDEFSMLFPKPDGSPVDGISFANLNPTERRLVEELKDGPRSVDELTRQLGLNAATMSAMLISLEIKRAVRMLPGCQVDIRR